MAYVGCLCHFAIRPGATQCVQALEHFEIGPGATEIDFLAEAATKVKMLEENEQTFQKLLPCRRTDRGAPSCVPGVRERSSVLSSFQIPLEHSIAELPHRSLIQRLEICTSLFCSCNTSGMKTNTHSCEGKLNL